MALHEYDGAGKTYLSIVDGKFRQTVGKGSNRPEGIPEKAVRRDWKAPDGTEGTKWEMVYNAVDGTIVDMYIKDSEYGKFLNVEFDGGEVIQMHTDHRYFGDFVKKIASCDINKPVFVIPYDFEDPKNQDKRIVGVKIVQTGHGWEKDSAPDFFYDFEKKKNINGFPKSGHTKEKPYDKDDWKEYFLGVKKFLIAYLTLSIIPNIKVKEAPVEEKETINLEDPGEEKPKLEDVPF
ncbi:MAG TPA: hypothetical protein PL000_21120 [Anaerolineales bacterium]|jgi:hypothetical protein|nr:hypothetical protein [Anaerolineales bacterium]